MNLLGSKETRSISAQYLPRFKRLVCSNAAADLVALEPYVMEGLNTSFVND